MILVIIALVLSGLALVVAILAQRQSDNAVNIANLARERSYSAIGYAIAGEPIPEKDAILTGKQVRDLAHKNASGILT